MRVAVTVPLVLLAAWAAEAPPSPEAQQRFLAETREAALKYAQSLPDFICTQRIRRFVRGNRGGWQRIDTLTVRLSSTSQGEQYALERINGAPTDRSYESLGGATTRGELGTFLAGVFDPLSAAEFRFVNWITVSRRSAALYSYRVARENSRYQLQYFDSSPGITLRQQAGQRGEVVIDRETRGVLRISAVAEDIPGSVPLRNSSVVSKNWLDKRPPLRNRRGSAGLVRVCRSLPSRAREQAVSQVSPSISWTLH